MSVRSYIQYTHQIKVVADWQKVPSDWKRENIAPLFRNGKKQDPGNYGPDSLTSVPVKIMG